MLSPHDPPKGITVNFPLVLILRLNPPSLVCCCTRFQRWARERFFCEIYILQSGFWGWAQHFESGLVVNGLMLTRCSRFNGSLKSGFQRHHRSGWMEKLSWTELFVRMDFRVRVHSRGTKDDENVLRRNPFLFGGVFSWLAWHGKLRMSCDTEKKRQRRLEELEK